MKVINGNNIDVLKQYPDNYFDAVVTDPPYGLGKEPNAEELMKEWIEKGYHEISGTGFMGKCYHPDTEVLTNNGWKKISDISESQSLLSLNPSTHKIELKPVIKKYEYDFNGELIHLKHRSAEQLVTPNHNVWCSSSKGNFRLTEASKLPKSFGMSNQAIVEENIETNQILVGDKKYNANDFCFLVGMFIGDGAVCIRKGKRNDKVRTDNFIVFSFKKIKAVENILTNLKIVYSKNASSIKCFYINDDALVEYFNILGKAKEKHIPKEILNLNYSALKSLYDGLIETDGCIQGIKNQHTYSTISKRLADDVQELCLKIGISASISIEKKGGKKIVFGRLCETQTSYRLSMLPKDKIIKFDPREKNISKVAYSGKVNCVELYENHILYTRYNGKPVWSGNSWDSFVPQPIFWKEVFRVLKHGGHVVSFFGTRTYDWGVMAMRFAGFEVRDCIQWVYGCLSDDTEILTENGWMEYRHFRKTKKGSILVYNIHNDEYFFEQPEKWNEYTVQDTCYRIESDSTQQIVSRNHRCLIEKGGKLQFELAEVLAEQQEANIPYLESLGNKYMTTLATITPIEYSGVVFCPTVSTGAFVARRNGKIFLTGNSGFPKSHNIGKAIDKIYGAERTEIIGKRERNVKPFDDINGWNENNTKGYYEYKAPVTDAATQWEGWGSALKPANEPIVLARKPLEKGLSIAENVLKWGTGGINIDGCRVGTSDKTQRANKGVEWGFRKDEYYENREEELFGSTNGRFPANLILSHSPMCKLNGLKKVKGGNDPRKSDGSKSGHNFHEFQDKKLHDDRKCKHDGFADENGEETIEDWTCHEDCPIKIMDEQSSSMGMHSAGNKRQKDVTSEYDNSSFHAPTTRQMNRFGDSGGASRFFYCAKSSKSERNNGLDGFEEKQSGGMSGTFDKTLLTGSGNERNNLSKNFHPTVKPVKLMQYLVRLITPPNGKVLDPFCGSGTTGIACKLEGFEFVGIEQDAEYCKIAEARIQNYQEEPEEPLKFIEEESKPKVIQQSLF